MARRPLSASHAIAAKAARDVAALDEEAPQPAHAQPEPPPSLTPEPRRRGRPSGKRSNPEFKPTTLFLRTKTKRAASRLLEDRGDGRDLSELVEDLLGQWAKQGV